MQNKFKFMVHIIYIYGRVYQVYANRQDAIKVLNELKPVYPESDGVYLIDDVKVY